MIPVLIPFFLLFIALVSGFAAWRDDDVPWLKWVYVSASAVAWIIFGLISPGETPLYPAPEPVSLGTLGIPHPSFIFDRVSSPILLVLAGILLICALDEDLSINRKSWVFSLGGISMLGVLAGDVYTALLSWAAVDFIWIYYDLRYIDSNKTATREIISYAVRLLGPALLIVPGLAGIEPEFTYHLNQIQPLSAVFLIFASFFRLGIWLSSSRVVENDSEQRKFILNLAILPSTVSVVYLVRSAAAVQTVNFAPGLVYIGGGILVFLALYHMFFNANRIGMNYWLLGLMGIILIGLVLQQDSTAFILGPVLLAAVYLVNWQSISSFPIRILTLSVAVSFLPLPYLPGWPVEVLLSGVLPGVILGAGIGLFLSVALREYWTLVESISKRKQLTVYSIVGIAVLTATQFIVLFGSEYRSSGSVLDILPGFAVMAAAGVAGFRFYPENQIDLKAAAIKIDFGSGLRNFGYMLSSLTIKMVRSAANLLEGSAGLLWTLLIGFLILTLITIGGGG
jgi:hypothetical protein